MRTSTASNPVDPADQALRTALRHGTLFALALAVVGAGVGWAVAGVPGAWGAVLGAGLALAFQAATAGSVLLAARLGAAGSAAAVLGSWLVKLVILVAVLAALRGAGFYDPVVLFSVLVLAVLGTLVLDALAVTRARVPYVQPARMPSPDPEGQ